MRGVPSRHAPEVRGALLLAVRAAMAGLTPFQLEVVIQLYWERVRPEEVATGLGVDVSMVRAAESSALESMRGWLAKALGIEEREVLFGQPGALFEDEVDSEVHRGGGWGQFLAAL